jgi:hypothetical protein
VLTTMMKLHTQSELQAVCIKHLQQTSEIIRLLKLSSEGFDWPQTITVRGDKIDITYITYITRILNLAVIS